MYLSRLLVMFLLAVSLVACNDSEANISSQKYEVKSSIPKKVYSIYEVKSQIGELITFEGVVKNTYKNEKVCYLNFHTDYKKTPVAGVIFKEDFANFPPDLKNIYYLKTVLITGIVSEYKGRPQIIMHSSRQIEVKE